jgi:hypothetical protein
MGPEDENGGTAMPVPRTSEVHLVASRGETVYVQSH